MVVVTVWSRLLIHSFIPGVRTGERECVYILCLARSIEVGAKKEPHMATYESAGVNHGFREKHIQCSIPNPSQGPTSVTHAPVSPRNDTHSVWLSFTTDSRGVAWIRFVRHGRWFGFGTQKQNTPHATREWLGSIQVAACTSRKRRVLCAHTLASLTICVCARTTHGERTQ